MICMNFLPNKCVLTIITRNQTENLYIMTTYYPYSQLINNLLINTTVKTSFFSAWSVGADATPAPAAPAIQPTPFTELYY